MRESGFSLTEVLIALTLIVASAVLLLQQTWQNLQLAQQMQLRDEAMLQLDNVSEQYLAGARDITVESPFQLNFQVAPSAVLLQLSCLPSAKIKAEHCRLHRQLSRR